MAGGQMTNKYLEKIARTTFTKVELEPGVVYNLDKHELEATKPHMDEYMERKDRNQRLGIGGIYGATGAIWGGIGGGVYFQDRLRKETPRVVMGHKAFENAKTKWEQSRPLIEESNHPKVTARNFNDYMAGRGIFKEHAIKDAERAKRLEQWRSSRPDPNYFTKDVMNAKPRLTNLVNKFGKSKVEKGLMTATGLVGALGLGGAGYLVGGLDPTQKKPLKNEYLERLERKHEQRIDELEGWHD